MDFCRLLSLGFTSPTVGSTNGNESQSETRSGTRLKRWAAATAVWLVFTTWFFGPTLLSRIRRASGGECALRLLSGDVHCPHCSGDVLRAAAAAKLSSWSATPRLGTCLFSLFLPLHSETRSRPCPPSLSVLSYPHDLQIIGMQHLPHAYSCWSGSLGF